MPHSRVRFAVANIHQSLSHSGIVGLFGQRQVGKTTLLEEACKEYKTFDQARELDLANKDPELFIRDRKSPFGIDEAQLCPSLFPALKDWIRTHKRPGQFLLSGSVRFTSRKAIRESLTGRIVGIDLLPFTIAEAHETALPHPLADLLKIKNALSLQNRVEKALYSESKLNSYLETGGLPGICFLRDPVARAQRFEFQVDTILSRDYQLVHESTLAVSSLRDLLRYIAIQQGQPLNLKEAGEFSQISKVTIKKVLHAFESLFLIRELPSHPESGEVKRAYYLEDQGMATWLTQGHIHSTQHHLGRGLYANLRQELFYQPGNLKHISYFRTKNGVNVPLVFQINGRFVGVLPSAEKTPSPKTYASAESFLKAVPHALAVIACANASPRYFNARMLQVPYWSLFS